jgi:hypothetical protein
VKIKVSALGIIQELLLNYFSKNWDQRGSEDMLEN